MTRVEALAMSIAREHLAFEPQSEAFQTFNPGLLRPTPGSPQPAAEVNENGVRIFSSFQGGYRALVDNLIAKCSGRTHAKGEKEKLTPSSTLADLCKTYSSINIRSLTEFLQDALDDSAVNARTPIAFFLQEKQ